MKNKLAKFTGLIALSLGLANLASAVEFTLDASTATIVGGNTTSSFYQVNKPEGDHTAWWESGSAVDLYSFTTGGNSTTGFWVDISFDGNPQPVLTSAFMKAGDFYLWWDSSDLAAFNGGTFDSIILVQNGIWNPPHNNLLGISHAGLNGAPGTNVPDGGTTALMLGLGLVALALVGYRRQAVKA